MPKFLLFIKKLRLHKKQKTKQFLNSVKVRKLTLTNLIFNVIEKLNVNFTEKKTF